MGSGAYLGTFTSGAGVSLRLELEDPPRLPSPHPLPRGPGSGAPAGGRPEGSVHYVGLRHLLHLSIYYVLISLPKMFLSFLNCIIITIIK